MRFVLKPGEAACPADAVSALEGIDVVDRVAGKALLVESDEATLARHAEVLSGWTIARETVFAQPKPVRYTIGE